MDRHRVAVVIPALNESATIAEVVRSVLPFGRVVVVDDGSSDGTGLLAAEAGAEVVRHDANKGYDCALNSGFRRACGLRCSYVVTIDADGQHTPSQIARFVQELDAGCDLVLGIRDRVQRVSESIFAWTARCVWGVRDPLCGMKGYRISLYEAAGEFDRTGSIGTELAIRSISRGCRFAQVPVVTRAREGKPRFASTLSANIRILRAMTTLLAMHATGRLSN